MSLAGLLQVALYVVLLWAITKPRGVHLARRGWRMAVFVEAPAWASAPPEQKRSPEEHLRFADDWAPSRCGSRAATSPEP